MRYKMPKFSMIMNLINAVKNGDSSGYITPQNTAEELLMLQAGAIAEFPVVWVISGSTITGFLHPITGATMIFPNGGFAAVAITGGSINNTPIGATTPNTVKTSNLQATYVYSGSAVAGAVTNNNPRGRFTVPVGISSVILTNSLIAATSMVVFVLRSVDGTLTRITTQISAAGTATVTFDGAATTGGLAAVDFFVIN